MTMLEGFRKIYSVCSEKGGTRTGDGTPGAREILAGQAKEFSIVDFPFLFNRNEEADKVFDGRFGRMLLARLPEKGSVGLALRRIHS